MPPGLRALLILLALELPALAAAVHELDPARGETLQQVLANHLLKPGDTAVLGSGHHGAISISGAHNDQPITIVAKHGAIPTLSQLSVGDASRWVFRGLTISPSFGPPADKRGTIVTLGRRGDGASSDLLIEDCFVYTELDIDNWSLEDWNKKPWNGISLDNGGTNLVARNNHVLNTNFALALAAPGSLAEGNLVENFAGDGFRVMVDDLTAQENVIKNNYNVNDNHDDGIQAFLFNKGTGTVRRIKILRNIIVNREDPNQKFPGPLQGIGFFDGPLIDFLVEGNVVMVEAWHAIALYDAQTCTITGNSTYNAWSDHQVWITIDQKHKQQRDNTVTHNKSQRYKIGSPGLTEEDNRPITKDEFLADQAALLTAINRKFGATMPLTGLPRLGTPGNGVAAKGYLPNESAKGDEPDSSSPPRSIKPAAPTPTAEALARFDGLLHERIQAAAASARPPRFHASVMAAAVAEVRALDGDTMTLFLVEARSEMTMRCWPKLTLAERSALAMEAIRPEVPADRLIAAFYLLATGDHEGADQQASLAGGTAAQDLAASFLTGTAAATR